MEHSVKRVAAAAVLALAVFSSCKQDKTVPLFNGKDLAGWVVFTNPADSTTDAAGTFTVKDGVLAVRGQPYGYIRTEKQYKDYRVSLEFRWAGEKGSNSGFFQRVHGEDKIWPVGLECQLGSGNVGDLIGLGGYPFEEAVQQLGRFQMKPRITDTDPEKPVGEWNQIEVECLGPYVKYTVNGILANEAAVADVSGFIALQSEGGPVEFRNIRIQEL
jgi:hypothetical protein